MKYDDIKDKIVLIPYRVTIDNVELLGDFLWERPVEDSDFVFLYGYSDGTSFQPIERSQVEEWGCQPTYEYALKNTKKLYKSECYGDLVRKTTLRNNNSILIQVTNNCDHLGAVAIFYPGQAEKIAECLGGDFYFCFISQDDCMCHSVSAYSPDGIKKLLDSTNNIFYSDDQTLSNKVYRFNSTEKSFETLNA